MMKYMSEIALAVFMLIAVPLSGAYGMKAPSKVEQTGKHLIVIAAPSIADAMQDRDYAAIFNDIIEFDIAYANAVYGHDYVRILVDKQTRKYFTGKVPESVLVTAYVPHIWMRDFTTINPYAPVQFRYTAASFEGDFEVADEIQSGFNAAGKKLNFSFPRTDLVLDGGNIVDNYTGRVITTERFLEDNDLTYIEGKALLRDLLNVKEVAILPPDDPHLAHSDGMVMFASENTLILNRYEEPMRSSIIGELRASFPEIEIVEIEPVWDTVDETSACGINVNATVTEQYIYMPHFDDPASDEALKLIQRKTDKKVIPVPANTICKLGGSVRCLTWQLSAKQGKFLLDATSK